MKTRAVAIVLLLVVSACGANPIGPTPDPPPPPPPSTTATLVGAGDIGWCGPDGGPALTAALIDAIPGTVFTAGDNAYFNGSALDYAQCYHPTWGRFKAQTHPIPGNHEYIGPGALGYFGYFGDAAGNPGEGWYSYRLGAWHVFALNSETSAFPGSPQYVWLRTELAANPTRCALAYFHTPVFASGTNGGSTQMQAVWALLQESGVEVIVNGHNHNYERFAPQDSNGRADSRGIREFVVGTGGAPLTPLRGSVPNSQVRDDTTWGVIKLTLKPDSYDWQFVPVAGRSFTDSGSDVCH
jgi:Calcineurin-like phosphoesterase